MLQLLRVSAGLRYVLRAAEPYVHGTPSLPLQREGEHPNFAATSTW
jgi:hypothetical protein